MDVLQFVYLGCFKFLTVTDPFDVSVRDYKSEAILIPVFITQTLLLMTSCIQTHLGTLMLLPHCSRTSVFSPCTGQVQSKLFFKVW